MLAREDVQTVLQSKTESDMVDQQQSDDDEEEEESKSDSQPTQSPIQHPNTFSPNQKPN